MEHPCWNVAQPARAELFPLPFALQDESAGQNVNPLVGSVPMPAHIALRRIADHQVRCAGDNINARKGDFGVLAFIVTRLVPQFLPFQVLELDQHWLPRRVNGGLGSSSGLSQCQACQQGYCRTVRKVVHRFALLLSARESANATFLTLSHANGKPCAARRAGSDRWTADPSLRKRVRSADNALCSG